MPIPTYFCCESSVHPAELDALAKSGGALCPNLYYLGGECGIKQIAGLAVAFLAQETPAAVQQLTALAEARSTPAPTATTSAELASTFVRSTASAAQAAAAAAEGGSGGVDILLTNTVPLGVTNRTANPNALPRQGTAFSSIATAVARALRPRYHFAGGSGVYWARAPYRNEPWCESSSSGEAPHPAGSQHFFSTRFYALAPVNNEDKQRFLFAAAVKPIASMKHEGTPPDITSSPYDVSSAGAGVRRPRSSPGEEEEDEHTAQHQRQRQRGAATAESKKPLPFVHRDSACWFCLENPSVETHLLVRVRRSCYVALAKGAACRGHMLVVPRAHVPSTRALFRVDGGRDALTELVETVRAVARCLMAPDGPYKAAAVLVFERCVPRTTVDRRRGTTRTNNAHGHVQLVPFHEPVTPDSVDAAFATAGSAVGASFAQEDWLAEPARPTTSSDDGDEQQDSFFWYCLMTSSQPTPEEDKFEVQAARGVDERLQMSFGRAVACRLAGLRGRDDWRRCVLALEEEEREASEAAQALGAALPTDNP